ncbi:MAG: DoxX family protein [Hyphomicrobiaceae bacterium]|nr:MAG: DoxX family protein [Hyphomicrobiaceae bacterium]
MALISHIAPFVGRLFLGLLFLAAGANKLQDQAGTIAYIVKAGLPFPTLAYWGATLVELLGGILLIVGFQTRLAAAALTAFSIVAAIYFHANFDDTNQTIHFMKNFAIAGGLLQIVAFGAGAFSLDDRNRHRSDRLEPARG